MNKKLLLIPFLCSLLSAETVKSKEMRAHDTNYSKNYENSSNIKTTEDRVISSTAEASAQITIMVTLEVVSQVTSGRNNNTATMSFLDNNRIEITEEIAQGEGEHLETLLTMMKLEKNERNLKKIQNNFENLIYLSHNDFLNKLTTLI
jgi:hypothetical protein